MPTGVRLTDGSMAVAYRVEFLMTHGALVSALAWSVRETAWDEELPRLTGAQVEAAVRDTLHGNGAEHYAYWADNVSDRMADRILEWAEGHVDRVYGRALQRR